MSERSILFLDPEAKKQALALDHLRRMGHSIEVADSSNGVPTRRVDLAIVGLVNGESFERLRRLRESNPEMVLICGAEPDSDMEAAAINAGADEVVTRPWSPAQLEGAVRLGLEVSRLREDVDRLRGLSEGRQAFEELLGGSQPMTSLYRFIAQVASSEGPVLMHGERGCEFPQAVRAIHKNSGRRERPLRCIEGAAARPAVFAEMANGRRPAETGAGTIWIAGIGQMSRETQDSLFDLLSPDGGLGGWRLIATTEIDLLAKVQSGEFHRDLYYRINVFPMRIPPLRERIEDLPLLAADRLRKMRGSSAGAKRLSYRALLAASAHTWPGNIEELESALEKAASQASGPVIEPESFPADIATHVRAAALSSADRTLRDAKREFEQEYYRNLLQRTAGNMSKASKLSRVGRPYLYKKIREHGIDPEDFRG